MVSLSQFEAIDENVKKKKGLLIGLANETIVHCKMLCFHVIERQVCELDIIFNFEKAYYILDEFILGGEAQETSKKNVLKAIEQADMLQEVRRIIRSC